MKLGRFEINVLDTGIFRLDGGAMFGVVPKALWAKRYNEGDALNRIPLAARPMLIRHGGKNILVDTGNGKKYDEKAIKIYDIDIPKNDMSIQLEKHGLRSDEITDVILTHLHFDHAGGSTVVENGKLIPAFPNARYYVQKEHFDWALNPTDKDRASFIKEDFMPLAEEGLLNFIYGETELFEGIHLIPIYGHTHALQMIKLIDGHESLLYVADLCPTSAHLAYAFGMGYDNFPLTSMKEKKEHLPKAYLDNTIICFEHDAFLQACRLEDTGKGFTVGEKIIITEKG